MTADPNEPSPPAHAADAPRDSSTAPAEPVAEQPPAPPPRAVWTLNTPGAPWCPDEWTAHLAAIAPELAEHATHGPPHAHAAYGESAGMAMHADGWSLVLASRRGRLHAHRGEHREDAGTLLHFEGGWVASVADGAGSAAWSRLGSAIATHVVTHTLRERLLHGRAPATMLEAALLDAADAAHQAMRAFADACAIAGRELRTTLLVVALHAGRVGVLQVGDGAMALRRRDGTLVHPHAAATGDFSGEVAHFLPDDGALEQLRRSLAVHDATALEAAVLATDGVEDPWYPFTRHAGTLFDVLTGGVRDAAVLPGGLVPAWTESVTRAADPVHALGEWLAFEKRGENDDRTLCLIQRTTGTRG